jgi:pantothenate kinase
LHAGYGGTDKIREINCTGGGAYKFREIVKSKLGIQLVPCDEMRSMIRGLNFLLRNTKNEIFCFTNRTKKVHENVTGDDDDCVVCVCVCVCVCRVSCACVVCVVCTSQCG